MNLKLFPMLALLAGAHLLSAQSAKVPPCATNTFWINEFTRDERVVADNLRHARVVRWKPDNSDDRQKWVFSEFGSAGYLITNKASGYPIVMSAAGWFHVAFQAPLPGALSEYYTTRYPMFKLVPVTGKPDVFHLQEPTKNEYVSVGSDGGLVRWAPTGQNSQYFKLTCLGR